MDLQSVVLITPKISRGNGEWFITPDTAMKLFSTISLVSSRLDTWQGFKDSNGHRWAVAEPAYTPCTEARQYVNGTSGSPPA